MRIGFVVNDSLPGMGMPCSGQGLRAWGLIQGLRGRGIDARALVRHATLGARFQRWKDLSVRRFPDWLTIVNHENIGSVLAEFDVVVFHNWGAAANVAKPGGSDVRFVYDFFSATLVEHAFISSEPEYLDRIRRRKHEILEQCDLFFANGPGRRRYAQAYLSSLGIETQVHDIPTSLPWLGDTGGAAAAAETGPVLVGGYRQEWTETIGDDVLAALARALPDRAVVSVGAGQHYHFGPRDGTAGETADGTALAGAEPSGPPENLVTYDVLNFEDYAALGRSAAVFVDVSPLNEERLMSFSTRGILSVALGCPVIHNAETDLGALLRRSGAGVPVSRADGDLTAELLIARVRAGLDPGRRENCHRLWQDSFDADRGAADLVRLVEHG